MHKKFLAMALVLATACANANAQDFLQAGSADSVIGHQYVLSKWNALEYTGEREIVIEFMEGPMLSGAFCNRFSGAVENEGWILKMEHARTTRMACNDELMKLENAFFQNLRDGVAVMLTENGLAMRRDDTTFVFLKVDKDKTAAADDGEASEETAVGGVVTWDDLTGKKFTLTTVDGEDFKPEMGRQPFIQFGDDQRVSGSACNNFTGPGELADGVLTVHNAASTMMMCVDPALSDYERYFHKMLGEGVTVKLDGDALTLAGDGKTLEFKLDRQE